MADGPRLLDLTRLVSRVGRGPFTGIDRVEAAYLDRFLEDPQPARFLVAVRRGYVLLGKPAARALRERLAGRMPWGPPDLVARLSLRLPPARRLAEASLRHDAEARARPGGLAALIEPGSAYFNVGHANLGAGFLAGLGRVPGISRTVLIHDTIPLDHPEFTRPDTVAAFAAKLRAVSAHADRAVYVSEDTRAAAERRFQGFGRVPPGVVAPIGVTLAAPAPSDLPPGLPPAAPYFVTVGTIEPRKNHALLLDVWEKFHATLPEAEVPRLLILGSRGWSNEAVFRRLDGAAFMGRTVFELPGLSDGAVAALIEGAAGLLFPSRAEGFGLPPLEAAARGIPVVAAPLPVYRETLGDFGVYADPDDLYLWAQTIRGLAEDRVRAGRAGALRPELALPSWDAHFKAALTSA